MKNLAVKFENVTMEYIKTTERIDTLKEFIIQTMKRKVHYAAFRALGNISCEIEMGDNIGIIGANGAGKSTMMKLIAQVMKPTSGMVSIMGTVAPMLELGAGFDDDFSGYDNIFLNGAILGRSKAFLEDKVDDIVDFADLGDFIYSPVKNYSSGMRAKLGFAVATQIEPDILIVDEVLGVGDMKFQKKSENRMREMIKGGATAIIVSHNIYQIRELTEKTIWLDNGNLMMFDETKKVCDAYEAYMKN